MSTREWIKADLRGDDVQIQMYVYKQSGPKMAYVFTWGCSSALAECDLEHTRSEYGTSVDDVRDLWIVCICSVFKCAVWDSSEY